MSLDVLRARRETRRENALIEGALVKKLDVAALQRRESDTNALKAVSAFSERSSCLLGKAQP